MILLWTAAIPKQETGQIRPKACNFMWTTLTFASCTEMSCNSDMWQCHQYSEEKKELTDFYWKCLVKIKMAFDRRHKLSIIRSTTPSLSLKVTKPMPLCPGAGSSEEQQANISTCQWYFGGLHSKTSREPGSTGMPGRPQHRGDKSPCHHRGKACSDVGIHHAVKGSGDSHCLDHVKG